MRLTCCVLLVLCYTAATARLLDQRQSRLSWVDSLPDDPFEEPADSLPPVGAQDVDTSFLEVGRAQTQSKFPVDPFEVMTQSEISFPFGKPLPDNVEQLLGRDNSRYEHDNFNIHGIDRKTIQMDLAAAAGAQNEQVAVPSAASAEDDEGNVECPFKDEQDNTEMMDCPHPNGVCCYNSCCKSGARCGGTKAAPTCIEGDDNLPTTTADAKAVDAEAQAQDDTALPSPEKPPAPPVAMSLSSGGSSDGAGALPGTAGLTKSEAVKEIEEAEKPASESESSGLADDGMSKTEEKKKKKRGMAIWMANHNEVTRDPAGSGS